MRTCLIWIKNHHLTVKSKGEGVICLYQASATGRVCMVTVVQENRDKLRAEKNLPGHLFLGNKSENFEVKNDVNKKYKYIN